MQGKLRERFEGKKILVVGLGLQGGGVGLVKFLAGLGAKVTVTDLKTKNQLAESINTLSEFDINYVLGKHNVNDFLNTDFIFKGPSVPWTMSEIVAAEQKGIPIEMEASFFVTNCPAKVIGITGTRGKSTTAQMIYEALKDQRVSAYLAGNIPQTSTISLLDTVTDDDVVVLELSSWQLSGFHRKKLSPHISVFTNFYPDHLNYYKSMDEYFYDKKAIYLYQKAGDFLITNKSLEEVISKDKILSSITCVSKNDFPKPLEYVKGDHNLENAAAALNAVKRFGADETKAIETIAKFKGVPYRQQLIKTIRNVSFINDTTSTTPVATVKAIETFKEKPVVLIMGGNSKGLPTDEIIDVLANVHRIVLLKGTLTDEIVQQLKVKYSDKITRVFDNFEQAIRNAYDTAKSIGESYVILSPGATSFAMFRNEFHRGEEFNRIVGSLH